MWQGRLDPRSPAGVHAAENVGVGGEVHEARYLLGGRGAGAAELSAHIDALDARHDVLEVLEGRRASVHRCTQLVDQNVGWVVALELSRYDAQLLLGEPRRCVAFALLDHLQATSQLLPVDERLGDEDVHRVQQHVLALLQSWHETNRVSE